MCDFNTNCEWSCRHNLSTACVLTCYRSLQIGHAWGCCSTGSRVHHQQKRFWASQSLPWTHCCHFPSLDCCHFGANSEGDTQKRQLHLHIWARADQRPRCYDGLCGPYCHWVLLWRPNHPSFLWSHQVGYYIGSSSRVIYWHLSRRDFTMGDFTMGSSCVCIC